MQQIKAALFDFDGVLADTEPLYDQFWDDAGIRYHTGIPHFAAVMKAHGVQVGLVTSSENRKMKRAFQEMNLEGLFDTFVSENRITKGKPDPMCYLLAAEDLKRKPEECIVFEDSFAGISAATNAGMRVIGLSTTNSEDELKDKVYKVIPNLLHYTFEDYLSWQE